MAGFLAALAGGALQGVGSGIVAEARARREEAIEKMRQQMVERRDQSEREFRSGENEKDRNARLSEGKTERDWRSSEADKRGDLITGEDGSLYNRVGTTVTPIKTPDGQDFKTKPKKNDSMDLDVEKMVEDAVKTELGDAYGERDTATIEAARERNRYRIRKNLGLDPGKAPEQIEQAPRDVNNRVVGQVYTAPDGRKVRWLGDGRWELAQ